jgi:hypothetical protein
MRVGEQLERVVASAPDVCVDRKSRPTTADLLPVGPSLD